MKYSMAVVCNNNLVKITMECTLPWTPNIAATSTPIQTREADDRENIPIRNTPKRRSRNVLAMCRKLDFEGDSDEETEKS